MKPVIYDLCAGSGAWSRPYAEAGYDVRQVDLPTDVRLLELPREPVHGILAAPPCTVFAQCGYRWPRSDDEMRAGLSVVDACLRLVVCARPSWWALENPEGRLRRYLGPPALVFNPNDYGETYTKRTLLWGQFVVPWSSPAQPCGKNPIHYMSPGPDRASRRSITPAGFARAFFEANP